LEIAPSVPRGAEVVQAVEVGYFLRMKQIFILGLCMALVSNAKAKNESLVTVAEKSGWVKTGRYPEMVALCKAFQKAYPKQVRCFEFGKSPEGRSLMAMAVSGSGVLKAEQAAKKNHPVVLFQAGIHSGEIDGKDAGFYLLRQMLEGKVLPKALTKFTAVFVPIFSVDGHERFAAYNRPNQVGPEEMGWRTTAQNLNLNRDYVKSDAPEMAAMLKLLDAWDPLIYVDLHVTDGADFEHDVSVMTEPSMKGPEPITSVGKEISTTLMKDLTATGHLPLSFYPTLLKEDEPTSGFAYDIMPPRFSHGYWSARNRFGVLVETHSWKNYATRVKATEDTLASLFAMVAKNGAAWKKKVRETDLAAKKLAGEPVTLSWEPSKVSHEFEFLGYDYKQENSKISTLKKIAYDPSKKKIWKVPLFDDLQPSLTITAPKEGYYVPLAYSEWVGEKLKLHGIDFEILKTEKKISVEAFRATEATLEKASVEGRVRQTVKGEWKAEERTLPKGSLFVPIAQPKIFLVMHILEPTAPDSLVSWGFFHASFERKEYMEAYVTEQVAVEMLKDPKVQAAFDERLKDPEFAKNPAKRLEFFQRRHASWDDRYMLYPISRL
jgi:hypothetical protein